MRSTEAPVTALPPTDVAPDRAPRLGECLNCGAALVGPFCASCGQRDIPPHPSMRELVVDAFHELSGWDGRLSATLRALVRRPGFLTQEFLEGRRSRYLSPLRLYLAASVGYFLLAATAPNVRLPSGQVVAPGVQVGVTTRDRPPVSRPERVGAAARQSLESGDTLTAAERAQALEDIARAPSVFQPFLRRSVEDPAGFRRGIIETMPRMLFVLLPVFAAVLALFYRGRKYPAHLYFAIHLHSYIFFALATTELLKFTRVTMLVAVASFIAIASIPIHATLAFRRVYGGSIGVTLLKEVAIGAIYGVASFVALLATVYWVSIAG